MGLHSVSLRVANLLLKFVHKSQIGFPWSSRKRPLFFCPLLHTCICLFVLSHTNDLFVFYHEQHPWKSEGFTSKAAAMQVVMLPAIVGKKKERKILLSIVLSLLASWPGGVTLNGARELRCGKSACISTCQCTVHQAIWYSYPFQRCPTVGP